MKFAFVPLDQHSELGFGGTAAAFESAAQALSGNKSYIDVNGHLPINYLFRHAVELYLKSMIISIHRGLDLPFDEESSNGEPKVRVHGDWKKMYNVHSVLSLYEYFKDVVLANKSLLSTRTKTDWTAFPPELDAAISQIEQSDASGTFWRYPITKGKTLDKAKSSFQKVDVQDLMNSMSISDQPKKILLTCDDNDQIVESFVHSGPVLKELSGALKAATEILSGASIGLRVELADGW